MTMALEQPLNVIAEVACECCGGRRHERVASKRGFALRRCRDCGVVFVHPQPRAAELEALYRKEAGYFATAKTDLSDVPASSARWLDQAIKAHGIESGKFLDVGCANGSLIYAMRGLGWDVSGIDVNGDAVEIARKNELDARVGTIETAEYTPESFDVVYLGDVIEHVPSPRRVCGEIHRVLRPGGLAVMRTPNADSGFASMTLLVARALGGSSWAHSEAPYHLHEFTPRSLAILLESLGFEIAWNNAEGRSRFLYKLGATGAFDDLKRQMKARGGYRIDGQLLRHLPTIAGLGIALLPAYAIGAAIDRITGSGAAIFIGARKRIS